jgi:spore coat polysaccharide biosynthesis protein SpsF (cytidylyltransferase family)
MTRARFGCVAGIQARMSSTRLPGKVLADLGGKPLVQRVWERTRAATLLDEVFVLTSVDPSDDVLADELERRGIPFRRGSLHDVRSRYIELAEETRAQHVVRITGDCPFVAPEFIDLRLGALRALDVDFIDVSNNTNGAVEGTLGGHDAFSARALRLSLTSDDPRDAEHVASFFIAQRNERLRVAEVAVDAIYQRPGLRLQVDEPADLDFARRVWSACDHEGDGLFPLARAIRWIDAHPEARALNQHVIESPDNRALRALARAAERRTA